MATVFKQSLVASNQPAVAFKCTVTSLHAALAARLRPRRFQRPLRELDQRPDVVEAVASVHDAVPARTDQRRCSRCLAHVAFSDYRTHPTCGSNRSHLLR
jgi:hypothetical protein